MSTKITGSIALACVLLAACGQTRNQAQASVNNAVTGNAAQPMSAPAGNAAMANNVAAAATPQGDQEMELVSQGFMSGQRGLHKNNQIAFDQSRDQVVAQVSAILGQPTGTNRNEECPTGAVETVSFGSLDLNFANGRFAGWVLDGPQPALETYHGLAIGTPRNALVDELEAAIDTNSTIGTEASVNDVGALLSGPGPNDRVTTLFAGITCFAR